MVFILFYFLNYIFKMTIEITSSSTTCLKKELFFLPWPWNSCSCWLLWICPIPEFTSLNGAKRVRAEWGCVRAQRCRIGARWKSVHARRFHGKARSCRGGRPHSLIVWSAPIVTHLCLLKSIRAYYDLSTPCWIPSAPIATRSWI
jgi:hypothetical protein